MAKGGTNCQVLNNLNWGGKGADLLLGEQGADVLIGGEGSDLLSGGLGADLNNQSFFPGMNLSFGKTNSNPNPNPIVSSYGLKKEKLPKTEINDRVAAMLQLVQLPEGITVVSSETGDIRSAVVSVDSTGLNNQEADWSSPIFFYPDGTTSDAKVVLANPYDNRIVVRLRGLTGMASYTAADAEEEQP